MTFAGPKICFVNGQQAPFDGVVWATGYRYTLGHLGGLLPNGLVQLSEMESLAVPGLYFLGMDQQRTYRSRFLRGMRAYDRVVGQMLATRLARTVVHPEPEECLIDLDSLSEMAAVS